MDAVIVIGSETTLGNIYYLATALCAQSGTVTLEGLSALGLGVIMLMPLAMMWIGMWSKRVFIVMAAGIAWMGVSVYAFVTSTAGYDLHSIMGTVCLVFAFLCFSGVFWLKEKIVEEIPITISDDDAGKGKTATQQFQEWEGKRGLKSKKKGD